jgi:outer membrane protein OmpA-like peptidoglycan-associated protein/tetratricopeptide (TPR) repeat protein
MILLFVPWLAYGQTTNIFSFFGPHMKKAETLYHQLAYRNALPLYLAVVEKDSLNVLANQRIADCYFKLGETQEAERWYATVAAMPDAEPQHLYQYAQVLSIQGKYEEAHRWFTLYTASADNDPRAAAKLDFLDHISYYMRDSILYEVQLAPFNSDQSDFSPQYYDQGVVFVSARDRDLFVKHQPTTARNDKEAMLGVFFSPASTDNVTLFNQQKLRSGFHDGPVCFYAGGQKMSFSRNNMEEGKPIAHEGRVNLKLYFTDTNDRKMDGSLESFPYNDNSYSNGHPWVSEDGSLLFFASNMPGGQGGADLYLSRKSDGRWQKPENLGPVINTLGDEFYPYKANDTTLYFSSNGLGGLGGLDLYVSYLEDGVWTSPRNLGYPLNTSSDDFSMVTDHTGRNGLFASNRPGGAGYDDIYSFSVRSFFLDGTVIERQDSAIHVADATVLLQDINGNTLDTATTDSRGRFSFDLKFDHDYRFHVSREGYSWVDTSSFSTRSRIMGQSTIRLALWKQALFARGIVYSNESQSTLAGATVKLENLGTGHVDSLTTDSTGTYRFKLEPGKKYALSSTHEGFLEQDLHINTHNLFDGDLLNDVVLEEEYLDKVVIQFEFDQSEILPTEIAKLEQMHKDLVRRPNAKLHISAFADAQGKIQHNQELSDRRAAAMVKYFTHKGIALVRIEARGFGESLPLNQCSDGVDCTEVEHAANRRAELKAQLPHEVN